MGDTAMPDVPRTPADAGPERVDWAMQLLDHSPAHHVLGVGLSGTSVRRLLRALPGGRLTVLDRSSTVVTGMRAMAAADTPDERLAVHHGALADPTSAEPFDRVLASNVSAFWTTGGQPEAEAIRRCTIPGGRVVIAFAGAAVVRREGVVRSMVASLRTAGFVRITRHDTPHAFAVVSYPYSRGDR